MLRGWKSEGKVNGKLIMSELRQQKTLGRIKRGGVLAIVNHIDTTIYISMIRGEFVYSLLLFICIAAAFCFSRCCHLFFPKDKYFYFVLYQISELMQCLHVLPNKSRSERSRCK